MPSEHLTDPISAELEHGSELMASFSEACACKLEHVYTEGDHLPSTAAENAFVFFAALAPHFRRCLKPIVLDVSILATAPTASPEAIAQAYWHVAALGAVSFRFSAPVRLGDHELLGVQIVDQRVAHPYFDGLLAHLAVTGSAGATSIFVHLNHALPTQVGTHATFVRSLLDHLLLAVLPEEGLA